MKIPIVIGVSGHRFIESSYIEPVRQAVRNELRLIMSRYPHSPIRLLSALAIGADTICAEEALSLGIALDVCLPLPQNEYENDFSVADLQTFRALLSNSDHVMVSEQKETRDECYRCNGIYIASHSHLLMALWNGKSGNIDGCGTADIVSYMKNGGSFLKEGIDEFICQITTPRPGETLNPTVSYYELEPGSLESALSMTDQFNEDADGNSASSILDLYDVADSLAMNSQKKYIKALKILAILGVISTLGFLLYDELNLLFFLPVYGASMTLSAVIAQLASRKQVKGKYLQYRVLAETLRVQNFLTAAGISYNAADCFTWTQRTNSAWIRLALASTIHFNPFTDVNENVRSNWIQEQMAYHVRSIRKTEGKIKINRRLSVSVLVLTLIFFVFVFVLEFFFSPILSIPVSIYTLREILRTLMGTLSSVTLFLSGYYGKLSLERKLSDHRKMYYLYKMASTQSLVDLSFRDLMLQLATEEIIENGNWFSYADDTHLDMQF